MKTFLYLLFTLALGIAIGAELEYRWPTTHLTQGRIVVTHTETPPDNWKVPGDCYGDATGSWCLDAKGNRVDVQPTWAPPTHIDSKVDKDGKLKIVIINDATSDYDRGHIDGEQAYLDALSKALNAHGKDVSTGELRALAMDGWTRPKPRKRKEKVSQKEFDRLTIPHCVGDCDNPGYGLPDGWPPLLPKNSSTCLNGGDPPDCPAPKTAAEAYYRLCKEIAKNAPGLNCIAPKEQPTPALNIVPPPGTNGAGEKDTQLEPPKSGFFVPGSGLNCPGNPYCLTQEQPK